MSGIRESGIIFGGAGGGTFIVSSLFRSRLYKTADGSPDLRKINITLAILHTALAVLALQMLKNEGPEYIRFNLQRVKVVAGSDPLEDPFEGKIQETPAPLNAKWGVVSFFSITALSHLWYANSPRYAAFVREGHNPYRWLEYGVTASIMVYLVCLLNGVRDFTALIPIIGSNIITMYCGFAMEEAILRRDFVAAKQFIAIGFAALIHNFVAIDLQFFLRLRDIQTIKNPETGENRYRLPAWLFLVVLPTLVNFGLFGLVAYRWLRTSQEVHDKTGNLPRYVDTELQYMNLSLFSKTFLGLAVIVGYRNSGNTESILA